MHESFRINPVYKDITAVVSSKVISDNIAYLRKKAGTDLMPVLKANAYGHGMVETARICRCLGVKHLGVATVGEAIQLRDSGDHGRILAWLYDPLSVEMKAAAAKNIDIAIFDSAHIPHLSKAFKSQRKKVKVHLFIDTVINRNGVSLDAAVKAAVDISRDPSFELVGLMSHLCCAKEKNDTATMKQFRLFRELRQQLACLKIVPELVHISATDGILNYDNTDFTMVRSGSGLLGLVEHAGLTPAMSVSSKIIEIKPVRKGDGVGYGRTYIAKTNHSIAIVPIGYADLLPRTDSEKMGVYVNGSKRPILGLDSMDQITFRSRKNDKIGDEVKVFGAKKNGYAQTIIELAESASTIPQNITSHLGERVRLLYV